MALASVVAFALVFLSTSLGLSLVAAGLLRVLERPLRRRGPWLERRASEAALLAPPLLALSLTGVLVVDSTLALLAGRDHCLVHDHHLHLCPEHGAAWASQPWAFAWVVFTATFVLVRGLLSARAHLASHRAARRLRAVGTPLEEPACFLVPSSERFAFATGLFSSTVIFSSAAWESLDGGQREAILAHELAHVRHGDLRRRALLGFAALFGVPNLVQRALGTWELAAERICDRAAAETVGRPSTVASAILALVRATPLRLASGTASAAASCVPERIESLLSEEPGGKNAAARLVLAITVGCVSIAIACAALVEPLHHLLETILG